jgi:very-short-patch-repair endonuclease/predicted transcriptional regulator of viral defense system
VQRATPEVAPGTGSVRVVGVRDLVVVSGTPDQRIGAVADAQRGRISWGQLIAIGMTPRMIRTRVASGQLRPVHRGVYAVGHAAEVELGEETAALLAFGPDAVLTHDSAAALRGMIQYRPEVVDVTILGARYARSRPGIRVHRSLTLTEADVTTRKRLPVTTAARTLLDFAETHTAREIERALDEALDQRIVSRTKVQEILDRAGRGRRGTKILASLTAQRRPSTLTRSQPEEDLLGMLRAAGVATPQANAPLHGFIADFLWRQERVVVEVDGYQWHSSRSAFKRDRLKDQVLRDHGYIVLRFTSDQLKEEPLAVIARIVRAITERAPRPAA